MTHFQDKMETIDKLTSVDLSDRSYKLLEIFSFFNWCFRPDFQYNETYLSDFIPVFKEKIKKYNEKKFFVDQLFIKLKKIKIQSSTNIVIQLDKIWEKEFIRNIWESRYLNNGSLQELSNKSIYIKVLLKRDNKKIKEYYKLNLTDKCQNNFIQKLKDIIKIIEREDYNEKN